MFELKRLSDEAIPAALEKALRYRQLNEPAEARPAQYRSEGFQADAGEHTE